jgi:EpsG family
LLAYGFGFAGACWAASRGRGNAMALVAVFVAGALVSLSRQELSTGDLPAYIAGFEDDEWSLYYLREAIFWAVGRLLTQSTAEPRITFAVLDLALVAGLTRVMGGKMSWHLVVLIFAFPTVLGFTNIYRQLCASVVMMAALRDLRHDALRGVVLAVAACMIHIAMVGACMALLAVRLYNSGHRFWLLLLLPLLAISTTSLVQDLTLVEISGGTDNRGNSAPLYIVLGLMVHAIAAKTLWSDRQTAPLHLALVLYFVAGALSLFYAPDSTGSRVMMISIHLTAFLTLATLSGKPKQWIPVALLAALLVGPLVISASAWHLIFGYELD